VVGRDAAVARPEAALVRATEALLEGDTA
jgi:hypothetical protein